jgi:hypothetical protein
MRAALWFSLAAVWAAGLTLGSWEMLKYESTPAIVEQCANRWPSDSALARDAARPTLVMFLHPHCPCSRASVAELAELAARVKGQVAITLVFHRPAQFGPGWEQTDLWHTAESIPGATRFCDAEGVESERFHAQASGETLLYLQNGELAFHGGITLSRGHRGENAGRAALERLILGEVSPVADTPVFGCSLRARECVDRASIQSPEKKAR